MTSAIRIYLHRPGKETVRVAYQFREGIKILRQYGNLQPFTLAVGSEEGAFALHIYYEGDGYGRQYKAVERFGPWVKF